MKDVTTVECKWRDHLETYERGWFDRVRWWCVHVWYTMQEPPPRTGTRHIRVWPGDPRFKDAWPMVATTFHIGTYKIKTPPKEKE